MEAIWKHPWIKETWGMSRICTTATRKLETRGPVLIKSWLGLSSKTWNTPKPPSHTQHWRMLVKCSFLLFPVSISIMWFQAIISGMETQMSENFNVACSQGTPALLEIRITVLQPNPERFTVQIPAQKHLICLDRLPISSWTSCAGMNSLSASFEVCPSTLLMCTAREGQAAAHRGVIISEILDIFS